MPCVDEDLHTFMFMNWTPLVPEAHIQGLKAYSCCHSHLVLVLVPLSIKNSAYSMPSLFFDARKFPRQAHSSQPLCLKCMLLRYCVKMGKVVDVCLNSLSTHNARQMSEHLQTINTVYALFVAISFVSLHMQCSILAHSA